jgi:hypothetical protein
MKESLKDYILHLDNWVPKDILDTSLKEIKINKTWSQHAWSNSNSYSKHNKNGNKELDVCFGDNLTYIKELHSLLWNAFEKYILIDKVGGENLKGWKGFSTIRFNRYLKDQIMSKHVDFIHDLFTGDKRGIPILSIVGVLNDDYEGGEFIMFDDYEIKFKAGDIILFPSTFLYPHLVKPVKKGIRYAFVSWCY